MKKLTRRAFLQTGMLSSVALGTLNTDWLAPRRVVRVAVLGAGRGVVAHLAAVAAHPAAEVAMVAGGTVSHLRQVSSLLRARGFATPKLSTNPEHALADPSIDAVLLAGSEMHDGLALKAALAAGKAVFLDVPPLLGHQKTSRSFLNAAVATCLDLYRMGKIEIGASTLERLGSVHGVTLMLHSQKDNYDDQLIGLGALIESLLSAVGEVSGKPSLSGRQGLAYATKLGKHALLRDVRVVTMRTRFSQRPELRISGSRGSLVLRATLRPSFEERKERLVSLLQSVAEKTPYDSLPAERAFAAMEIARWIGTITATQTL